MLRKSTEEDISDEECEKVINPFYDNYHTFLEEYVMPEVIAYYLANAYYRNAMWEATFLQHFNSASDMFNLVSENYEKTKVIYEILYYCGLRKGELRGLQWKDINFDKKELSITKQITDQGGTVKDFHFADPKTKSSVRVLPIAKVLLDDLKTLKSDEEKSPDFSNNYFICGDAFPISSNTIANRKNIMCEEAGVKQIRIHDFRHSCASLLINNGATVPTVSKFLGHTKIEETLNTYTHLFGSALNAVVDLIDKLDDKS